MKKLLGKTLLYLLILLLIPYGYLIFQAKQGVDAFLLSHNFGSEVNYEWILVNRDGNIVLLDIKMGGPRQEPIFTAETAIIYLPSIFDLLGARDSVIHNEYPTNISVEVTGAQTSVPDQLAMVLGLDYQTEYLDYLYPQQCSGIIQKEITPLRFEAAAEFDIHRTADVSEVKFKGKSLEFANISGSLKINNYSESISDESFVSDFAVSLYDISLLQKNTQKCLAEFGMDKQAFMDGVANQLVEKSALYQLILERTVPKAVGQFMFVPQQIDLAFDIEEGKKFSQIPLEPFYQVPEKLGLSLNLNGESVNVIFDQVKSQAASVLEIEKLDKNKVESSVEIPLKPLEKIVLQKYQLKHHIGAKVALDLRNGKKIEGYVQSVNTRTVILLQRKFKGKTVAPFSFKDIMKITLINAEK